MEQLIEFLKGFNAQTLMGMAFIVWYFARHIESKFESRFEKLETKMDAQGARIDRLYEMFVDLRKEFHEEMREYRKKSTE